jgi:UDP-N-acetylmuramoylalanine--D-glutamate ligase
MRVLVIGAAVSGRAAASLAASLGDEVVIYDRYPAAVGGLEDAAFTVVSGEWEGSFLQGIDLVVTSPGVPEHARPIRDAMAAGTPLWSELEYGTRHLEAPYLAVTGTNGKTTVTRLTAAMLQAGGVRAAAAGNIGTPVSGLVSADLDLAVLEASSFQLRFIDRFRPLGAAVLNVAPDHLDWHETMEGYAAAKARIFENMTRDDLLAYDADDPGAADLVAHAAARLVPVAVGWVPVDGAGVVGGELVLGDTRLPLPTVDPSYGLDVAVAAILARAGGADDEAIAGVAAAFSPGRHRREVVATTGDVTWVNDSKATNPHAARAAAAAYPSVVLIAGGRNKGLDLADMVPDTVRHVVAYGEAGPEVGATVASPVTVVTWFDDAVAEASRLAAPGDVVLLAPGAASFDQFDSYEERGDRFVELVGEITAAAEVAK